MILFERHSGPVTQRAPRQLLHESGAVILGRSDANTKPVPDLFVAVAFGKQLYDFLFTAGEASRPGLPALWPAPA